MPFNRINHVGDKVGDKFLVEIQNNRDFTLFEFSVKVEKTLVLMKMLFFNENIFEK